jgi:hypothetical protein
MKPALPRPTALYAPFGAALGLLVFLFAAATSCGSLIVVTDAGVGADGGDGSAAAGGGVGAGGPGGAAGAGGAPAVTIRLTGTIEAVGQLAPAVSTISIINAGLSYDRTRICNSSATLCVTGGVVP